MRKAMRRRGVRSSSIKRRSDVRARECYFFDIKQNREHHHLRWEETLATNEYAASRRKKNLTTGTCSFCKSYSSTLSSHRHTHETRVALIVIITSSPSYESTTSFLPLARASCFVSVDVAGTSCAFADTRRTSSSPVIGSAPRPSFFYSSNSTSSPARARPRFQSRAARRESSSPEKTRLPSRQKY